LDIACIVMALPILIPLALLIVILIKIRSAGPILFRQERVGFRGSRFTCLKFRSMVVGADDAVHRGHCSQLMNSNLPMEKMDARGDTRLVPYGRLLRASGLDELPQLINVLRGEMSLVGPRPCLPYEYDHYLPWHKERFNTVPGLTGLWQVSGKNRTTFDEMVRLDIRYAQTKTLWMDLNIMLRTLPMLVIQVLETWNKKKTSTRTPSGKDRRQGSENPSGALVARRPQQSSKPIGQLSTREKT
jgi:lipopolysaccharide/colanic/teichoic acid biosynthesis glycosyltransferase